MQPAIASTELANAETASYVQFSDEIFIDCRQRLITYLVKLNQALDQNAQDLSHALLSRFCDSLVDYLSAGHFRVFQRLVPAPHEYAAIESTTQAAMAFNDAFGDLRQIEVTRVKQSLEPLAQLLSSRFELEDDIMLSASG